MISLALSLFISLAQAQVPPPSAGSAPPRPSAGAPPPPTAGTPTPPAAMPAELLNDTNQNQNGVDVLSPPIQVPVFGEEYTYDPTGRRDPFNPPKAFIREANKPGQIVRPKTQAPIPEGADPLQRMDLDKAMLVGIIWEVANPRAMLVDVGDPTHTVYIVTKKTKVGRNNGYVSAIREGELVIIESFEEDGIINQIPRILSLKKDQK